MKCFYIERKLNILCVVVGVVLMLFGCVFIIKVECIFMFEVVILVNI